MSIVAEEQNHREHISSPKSNRRNIFSFYVSSLNDNANDDDISSGLTLPELLDEIKNFVHGGFDTTATVLAWLMHFASKHPHVQQRIKDELREHDLIPVSDNVALNLDVLNSLIYVNCVIKEVFRCAPIIPGLSRTALCDGLIDGTIHVKKDDTVLIPIYNIHSDPRYWHIDPSKFVPERFLHEDKDHHPFAFIPFGGGHRACAGQELAWLELKTIVTRLMQRVTFEDTGMEDNSGGYDQQMLCYPKHLAVNVRVDNE
ncbi:unnamed protein product [Rotaria sp. Silwood2]|nr:unnamed protein product [Rotaria sp. Silwood2]